MYERIALEVIHEAARAVERYGHRLTFHEGYAVLLEEVDELWDAIKEHFHNKEKIRKEAIQVAAMAITIVGDLCDANESKT